MHVHGMSIQCHEKLSLGNEKQFLLRFVWLFEWSLWASTQSLLPSQGMSWNMQHCLAIQCLNPQHQGRAPQQKYLLPAPQTIEYDLGSVLYVSLFFLKYFNISLYFSLSIHTNACHLHISTWKQQIGCNYHSTSGWTCHTKTKTTHTCIPTFLFVHTNTHMHISCGKRTHVT